MTQLFKALKHAVTDQAIKEAGIERISYKIRIENNLPCPDRTSLHFLDRFEILDMKQVIRYMYSCKQYFYCHSKKNIKMYILTKVHMLTIG